MFTINEQISDLNVKDRNIFKIIYSMNNHPVAAPDMSVEEARCYILFFSEGPNLTACIGLYLPRTDRKFFYSYSSNPFPFEAATDVESEARTFAEDMGFLLDEIDVSGMAPEDRNHWIEEQYIFGYKKPAPAAEEQQDATAEPETPQGEARDESQPGVPSEPQQEPEPEHAAVSEQAVPKEPIPAPAAASPVKPEQETASAPAPAAVQPTAQQPPQQAVPTPVPGAETAPVQQSGQPVYPPVQPYQPPYPQQPYPPHPGYPVYQPQPTPPQGQPPYPPVAPPQPKTEQMRQPLVEEPEAPQQPAPRQRPAAQRKGMEKERTSVPKQLHKAPVTKTAVPFAAELEETVTIDHEEHVVSPKSGKPERLFEEAIRQGVVKPPKPKTSQAVRSSARGVTRDKEALARLLASF